MNLPLMFNPTVGLCRDDISKIDDENFMSRWRKNNQKINISCLIVPIPSKTTPLVDYSRLCNLFNIAQGNLEYSNMKQFPLCSEHYGILYRQLNPTSPNCRTCSKVINDTSKLKKSPNLSLIQQFLSDNQDFVGTIDEDDMFVIHAINRTPYRSNSISEKRTEVFNSTMDKSVTPEYKFNPFRRNTISFTISF